MVCYTKSVKSKHFFWLVVISLCFIYVLLAFKHAFSPNSLVGNLEPYPDTLYYATPAWNFVHGKGFTMSFEGHKVDIITQPLYSLYLTPFFAIFRDVRAFYFANIILLLSSIVFFCLTLRKMLSDKFDDSILIFFFGFFLVTNFYTYTLPQLLMAESLTFFLSSLAIYLLVTDATRKKSFIASFLGLLLLLTKFSNLPLAGAFYFLYILKILKEKKRNIPRVYFGGFFFATVLFIGYLLLFWTPDAPRKTEVFSLFSTKSFVSHMISYLRILLAEQANYLWLHARMISPLVSVLSIAGAIAGLLHSATRQRTIQFLILIFSTLLFMSFFYTTDARYIIAIYPAVLLLGVISVQFLKAHLSMKTILFSTFVGLLIYLFIPNQGYAEGEVAAVTFAKQAVRNIRGSETAWYYVAVTHFNDFFQDPKYKGSYLGTFLPPFFVEFYSNKTYNYLPIAKNQDFFSEKGKLAKQMGIKDIPSFYSRLLSQNKRIFVSNTYVGNLREWGYEFENLKKKFNVNKVSEGCFGTCDIYEITLSHFP